jgi:YidC/Oxa1 family membrane protein insertase
VIAFEPFQMLLDGMGWILAQIYDLVPNWGLSIIVLTVLIRIVLLPLGVKQIRSMQNMQIIQPKVKQIQQKYKGNKQKQQEEIMSLYRDHGVNPFSGCWPVLLQFPILIAMYSVVRFPQYPVHIPESSKLYEVVTAQIPETPRGFHTEADLPDGTRLVDGRYVVPESSPAGTDFLSMNLLCSAQQAGNESAEVQSKFVVNDKPIVFQLDCGQSVPERIPYYLFAGAMFATTFLQQRQMQRASPPGASSQQQQALLKIMPLMFGVFGFFFPVGLVLYWTTSNAWQIGQQYFMLKNRPTAETLAARANGRKERKGFMASMMDRANQDRKQRDSGNGRPPPKRPASGGGRPGTPPQRKPGSGGGRGAGGTRGAGGSGGTGNTGGTGGSGGTGGPGAGSRKKRPKR